MFRTEPRRNAAGEAASARRPAHPLGLVIAASMLSKVADWQLGIVVPLAVLERTRSAPVAILALTLHGVAYVVAPVLGSLIDRFDKRVVFVCAQFQQALCLALLALLPGRLPLVATLLFLAGFGAAVGGITSQFVLVPTLVDTARRETAVARLASSIELAKVVGLLLGGLVFAAGGAATAAWCVAALYAVAGVVALRLPALPSIAPRQKLHHDLATGFRWVSRPDILWLVVTMAMANLAVGELETVLVTVFGSDDVKPTVISTVIAAGLLLGALGSRAAPRIATAWPAERRILIAQVMAFGSLCTISLPSVPLKVLGYASMSAALGFSNVASITYRQQAVPTELAGRVNAVIRMFITGAVPLSGFIYAGSSHLDGFRLWVPALAIAGASVAVWSVYAYHRERTGRNGRDLAHRTTPIWSRS